MLSLTLPVTKHLFPEPELGIANAKGENRVGQAIAPRLLRGNAHHHSPVWTSF